MHAEKITFLHSSIAFGIGLTLLAFWYQSAFENKFMLNVIFDRYNFNEHTKLTCDGDAGFWFFCLRLKL